MAARHKLSTDVKKQHTVPRFLLDHFGTGKNKKKRKLYTFDKHNNRRYLQSVYDATTRNTFYNIEGHPEDASLEPVLGDIESNASPIIKRIVKEKNIGWLSDKERSSIAAFTVIQRARSYNELKTISELLDSFSERLVRMGASTKEIENEMDNTPEGRKNFFLQVIVEQLELAPHILNKQWILYETTKKAPFIISDNPVTLHNDEEMRPYGNIGLAVRGIQIHLPLSSTLTLAFTCPTIAERAIRAKNQLLAMAQIDSSVYFKLPNASGILEYGEAYENGSTMKTSAENVRFLNSLQVTYSEQYLYCEYDDFALAEEMLSHSDRYKHGMRMKIN